MNLKKFFKYYIKGDYHCDRCPYSWEDRGYDDADAGCYIKGDLDEGCRLWPIVRNPIGYFRKKRHRYFDVHQYDDLESYMKSEYAADDKLFELLMDRFSNIELCSSFLDKMDAIDYKLVDKSEFIRNIVPMLRMDYDSFAHPVVHKRLRTRFKELIKDMYINVAEWFKIYFGRSE